MNATNVTPMVIKYNICFISFFKKQRAERMQRLDCNLFVFWHTALL